MPSGIKCASVWPCLLRYETSWQRLQGTPAAECAWKYPGSHRSQAVCPDATAYWPAASSTQSWERWGGRPQAIQTKQRRAHPPALIRDAYTFLHVLESSGGSTIRGAQPFQESLVLGGPLGGLSLYQGLFDSSAGLCGVLRQSTEFSEVFPIRHHAVTLCLWPVGTSISLACPCPTQISHHFLARSIRRTGWRTTECDTCEQWWTGLSPSNGDSSCQQKGLDMVFQRLWW